MISVIFLAKVYVNKTQSIFEKQKRLICQKGSILFKEFIFSTCKIIQNLHQGS